MTESIRVSAAQREYLLGAAFLPVPLRQVIADGPALTSGATTVEIDHDLAERFRALFTERLAQVGFDAAYELTGEGVVLEELLDVFFRGPAS